MDQVKKGMTEGLNLERDFLMRRSGLLLPANVGNLKAGTEVNMGFF